MPHDKTPASSISFNMKSDRLPPMSTREWRMIRQGFRTSVKPSKNDTTCTLNSSNMLHVAEPMYFFFFQLSCLECKAITECFMLDVNINNIFHTLQLECSDEQTKSSSPSSFEPSEY